MTFMKRLKPANHNPHPIFFHSPIIPSPCVFLTLQDQYDINSSIMAGPPENRTAPVLDATARRRIGEFYLIQVLKGSDGRVYRRQSVFSDSYDFRAIDSAIALRVLASIPGDL